MNFALSKRGKIVFRYLMYSPDLSIDQISNKIGVSSTTVRNDIRSLREKGYVVVTRGGSIPAFHPSILKRFHTQIDKKEAVAKAAAALIKDGDTIFVDTGTTTALTMKYYFGKRDLQIVTNSTLVLPYSRVNSGIHLFLVGGDFRPSIECMVGKLALSSISNFHAKYAFIGSPGFSLESGVMNEFLEAANIVKAMSDASENVILLADSSKYGKRGFAKVFPMERLDMLLTNRDLNEKVRKAIQELGVKPILV